MTSFPLKYFFLSISVFFSVTTRAQDFLFKQLGLADGLPSVECYNLIVDNNGYVWAFTQYGIVKHNGQQFIPACLNIPRKDQNAYAVCKDSRGNIYFANSYSKVYKIVNNKAIPVQTINNFTQNFNHTTDIIYTLYVDSSDNVYFATFRATYKLNNETKHVSNLQTNQKKSFLISAMPIESTLFPLRQYPANVATISNMLFLGRKKSSKILGQFQHGFFDTQIHFFRFKNAIICNIKDTLVQTFNNGNTKEIPVPRLLKIRKGSNNTIWAITRDGLYLFNDSLKLLGSYLQNTIVTDVCTDRSNGLWVSTIDHGIYYCKDLSTRFYARETLNDEHFQRIQKTGDQIYLFSSKGSMHILKNEKCVKLIDAPYKATCTNGQMINDRFYLSTKNGLFCYKSDFSKFTEIKTKDHTSIYSSGVFKIDNHSILNYGHSNICLFEKHKQKKIYLFSDKINHVISVSDFSFLVATQKGIYSLSLTDSLPKTFIPQVKDMHIAYLAYDCYHNLWIGTKGEGLYCYSNKKKLYQFKNAPFFSIQKIHFDNSGNLIVSTNLGIFKTVISKKLTYSGWQHLVNSYVFDSGIANNNLYVLTDEGMLVLNLQNQPMAKKFPIRIGSVWCNNIPVEIDNTCLSYKQNDLRFNIDFLNYKWPVENFHFILHGPTQLQGNIRGNVLQVQNLQPGEYTLKIHPLNGEVFDKRHNVTLSFCIEPAFWQTFWFKLLMFFTVIVITVFVASLYFTHIQKREKTIDAFNRVLSEHKLTALKAQINPHFISNSLTAIQSLIERGKIDDANLYIAKFSLLIRNVLNYSDKSAASLSEELNILNLNVELEKLRFKENSFQYIVHIDDSIDEKNTFIPPLLMQPLVENAIWHGLLPLLGKRTAKLTLTCTKVNDALMLSVIDNGVGRRLRNEGKIIGNLNNKKSKGFSLIEKRIENLNKLYNLTPAGIVILDLYQNDGSPAGTRIDITLPFELLTKIENSIYEGTDS